ncbi:replication protein P [Legionella anisa]|uniref:replication protein P n=1 Tax=Legionella anisa TaxID=28082 RepID=UPI0010413917|nr:replication protein P [Legionella anisa]
MTISLNLAATELQRKRIDRLFLRFAAMYGQVWRSQFKSDEYLSFTKGEWLEGLVGYEDKVLDAAVQLCRHKKEFPPTLPQFIDFCEQSTNKNKFFKADNSTKHQNPELAKAYLQKIKQILNIKVQ